MVNFVDDCGDCDTLNDCDTDRNCKTNCNDRIQTYCFKPTFNPRCNPNLEKKICKKNNCIFYVKSTNQLHKALDCLEANTTIKLCRGTYSDVDFNLKSKLLYDQLEIIGDESPFSGVSFFQGAEYEEGGLLHQQHLSSCIGKCQYNLHFNKKKCSLEVSADCKPNFSKIGPCTKIKLMDKDGNSWMNTIKSCSRNTIYFQEPISNITQFIGNKSCEGDAVKGVGFTILPNVVIESNKDGCLSGVKCLRMSGIHFKFNDDMNNKKTLIYGENYSNIENCVFSESMHVISNARLAVSRAPNTIFGEFTLNDQTNNKFIYNSVIGEYGKVTANNCSGMFSYSLFVHNNISLKVINNSNIDGSCNNFYQVTEINMYVSQGSKLKASDSYVYYNGDKCPYGLKANENSIIVTSDKEDNEKPICFIKMNDGETFKVKLTNHTIFYNWGGDKQIEIGSTDSTSHYYHTKD